MLEGKTDALIRDAKITPFAGRAAFASYSLVYVGDGGNDGQNLIRVLQLSWGECTHSLVHLHTRARAHAHERARVHSSLLIHTCKYGCAVCPCVSGLLDGPKDLAIARTSFTLAKRLAAVGAMGNAPTRVKEFESWPTLASILLEEAGVLPEGAEAARPASSSRAPGTETDVEWQIKQASLRTCRVCKLSFSLSDNMGGKRPCSFHPGFFSGETRQRWMAPGETAGAGDVLYFYSCCGAESADAPGCASGPHEPYD